MVDEPSVFEPLKFYCIRFCVSLFLLNGWQTSILFCTSLYPLNACQTSIQFLPITSSECLGDKHSILHESLSVECLPEKHFIYINHCTLNVCQTNIIRWMPVRQTFDFALVSFLQIPVRQTFNFASAIINRMRVWQAFKFAPVSNRWKPVR